MKLIESLESVGQYTVLMKSTLTLPDRFREFIKDFFKEMYKLGVNSLWIVMIISFFIGAVMVVQIALNVASPLLPRFTVGVVSREIILLEHLRRVFKTNLPQYLYGAGIDGLLQSRSE